MSIEAACNSCGGRFAAPPNLAGQQVGCPSCGKPIIVPSAAPAGGIVAACQCGKQFQANASLAGQTVACPACSSPITIPSGVAATAQQPAPAVAQQMPMDNGFGDALANEAAWSQPAAPAMGGGMGMGNSNWQGGAAQGDDNKLLMRVGIIGGSVLGVFVVSMILWSIFSGGSSQTADNDSDSQSNATSNDSSSTPSTDSGDDSNNDSNDEANANSDDSNNDDSQPAEAATEIKWEKHTSSGGNFEIEMPGTVKTEEVITKTKAGDVKLVHTSSEMPDKAVVDVTYFNFPADSIGGNRDDLLEKIKESFAKSWQGTVEREVGFDMADTTGHEFLVQGRRDGKRVGVHARIIIIDLRVYQITWAKSGGNAPSPDSEKFVRSFKLKS